MRRLVWSSGLFLAITLFSALPIAANSRPRDTVSFNKQWRFHLGDAGGAQEPSLDDSAWRQLNLPHDWSIEGQFSQKHPATPGGGALPGGLGWYRKTFTMPATEKNRAVFIDFDGVYRNSEVWINGHYLGKRPYGYSSFRYYLSPHLKFGDKNVIAVKVDNSQQPNSRWYSGSGIYRNVWLTITDKIFVDHWGTSITTPEISQQSAKINIRTSLRSQFASHQSVTLTTIIYTAAGKEAARVASKNAVAANATAEVVQTLNVNRPALWSVENPHLYKAISEITHGGKVIDRYETPFGIRYFVFDRERGLLLNGKLVKINGVCNHHDLGSLGAAINTRALERQLELLKAMGANAIRMSHNPPAPELLDLCDRMGFIVMDEAFDVWEKKKTDFDYHLDWAEWHKRDLEDMVRRDRNHPSIFIWSIGNEVPEQGSPSGVAITKELAAIVRSLDSTRPVTAACDKPWPGNSLIKSGALDLLGFNYHQNEYANFPKIFPEQKFIATEAASGLETRGHYDMPSDVIRRWPPRWDAQLTEGNADYTCSAYDNCSAPWGSTHEEAWKVVKKLDFFSGMFVWTGFDYLGEPTPYGWPARSSYFGILDLAGFPKDVYYMYQSEWTTKPVLHIFPHWNWKQGVQVDVWAYFNSEEVELFLNDKSLGSKRRSGDDMHVWWRVAYEPGTLKAIARAKGKPVLTREIRTAGKAAKIILIPDRAVIKADGSDLSFVTVKIVDEKGTLVPHAAHLINFDITGEGFIAGVDNGSQVSHEPFKADYRKAFNGLCLAIIQAKEKAGSITLKATAEGLAAGSVVIQSK